MALATTNLALSTVRTALGYTADWSLFNIGTSSLINKWSRFKPVRAAGLGETVYVRPRGDDGNCGFILPTLTGNSGTAGVYTNSGVWGYAQPRGGSPGGSPDEPVRLGDFRGYEHSSTLKPPFYSDPADNIYHATLTPAQQDEEA